LTLTTRHAAISQSDDMNDDLAFFRHPPAQGQHHQVPQP
jgi:hypothetical protein